MQSVERSVFQTEPNGSESRALHQILPGLQWAHAPCRCEATILFRPYSSVGQSAPMVRVRSHVARPIHGSSPLDSLRSRDFAPGEIINSCFGHQHAGVAQRQSNAFVRRGPRFRNSLSAQYCGATTACVEFPAAPQLERGMTWRCGLTAGPDGQRRMRKHRPRSGRRRVEMAADFSCRISSTGRAPHS